MHNVGTAGRRVRLSGSHMPLALHTAVEALLRDCNRRLIELSPGWLGHCKALIEGGDGSAYASLTGADQPITWRGQLHGSASEATLTLYCAVYGLDDTAIEGAVTAVIAHHLPDAIDVPAPASDLIALE
jgi:hypothetical protein